MRRKQNDGMGGPTPEGPKAASVVAILKYARYVNCKYKRFHVFFFRNIPANKPYRSNYKNGNCVRTPAEISMVSSGYVSG